MRHRRRKELNLNMSRRNALLRSQVNGLFEHGAIRTTEPRARQVQVMAEKMITFAKSDSIAGRRRIMAVVRDRRLVRKIVDDIAPRYADRPGGYTQLLKLPARKGDGSPLTLLSLLS